MKNAEAALSSWRGVKRLRTGSVDKSFRTGGGGVTDFGGITFAAGGGVSTPLHAMWMYLRIKDFSAHMWF